MIIPTILMIEDDPASVELVKNYCTKAGIHHPLHIAVDGDQGFAYLSGKEQYADRTLYPLPFLLLLDLDLPGKSGFEILAWIRSQPDLFSIPVVILSKANDLYIMRQAYDLGANGYLVKPFAIEELYNYVLRHSNTQVDVVTDRRKIIEELRRSEMRVQFAQQAAQIGSWEWDARERKLYWSPQMYEIFEKDPDNFFPEMESFMDLILPEDRKIAEETVRKSINQFNIEYRIYGRDNKIKWLAVKGKVFFDATNQPSQAAGTVQEVTQRKIAEEALARQNSLLEAIINSAHNIIIFAVNREFRYILFNELHRAEMKKNWSKEISNDMNILDQIQLPSIRESIRSSIERALKGEAFTEIQHQPEFELYYEYSWNPIWSANHQEVIGASVFIQEITERVLTEHTIRQQVDELQRWHAITLNREVRILELKNEVNDLLARQNQPARYFVGANDEQKNTQV